MITPEQIITQHRKGILNNYSETLYSEDEVSQIVNYILTAHEFIESGVMTQKQLTDKIKKKWKLD